MDLADILTKNQIVPDLQANTCWEAIDELINNLVATGKIKPENREAIATAVKKREQRLSTGIGFGVGIPHAVTDLIPEVIGALGRSGKGIQFEALDNQPVTIVVSSWCRKANSNDTSTRWPASPSCFTRPTSARPWPRRRTPKPCSKPSRSRGRSNPAEA